MIRANDQFPPAPKSPFEVRERIRVAGILKRDRDEAAREKARAMTLDQIANGFPVDHQPAVVTPTPELIAKGVLKEYTVPVDDSGKNDVRTVVTYKRRQVITIKNMWKSGALSDEEYAALKTLAHNYEYQAIGNSTIMSNYGFSIQNRATSYDFLPRTEKESYILEYIHRAMALLSKSPHVDKQVVLLVVRDNVSLNDADCIAKIRKGTSKNIVCSYAKRLYEMVRDEIDVIEVLKA